MNQCLLSDTLSLLKEDFHYSQIVLLFKETLKKEYTMLYPDVCETVCARFVKLGVTR